VVAISFIIHSLVTRIVLRPVRRIVEGTERVAAGDLQHPVELGKQDEIGRLAKSFNDMTQQLALAQRQVIQSNKLSSVGRLAAGVAHEINNPLTGVLTYSSFLLKQAEDQPEMKEDLEVIVRETKRCRDIVKGLLDFSRQSVTEKRHVKVNDFVKSACKIVQHQLSLQHTDIDLKLEANLPPILADQNQMQQVLVNLIVNAADAYPEGGGAVTVETTLVSNDTSKIRVRVVDTGCGIPEDRIDKIFEPFYSTKGGKGTGLGLAIAWGIVEAHNGVFTVNSEPGRGTTFDITLPLADRGGTP
jgi:two-component system NtrC family sensor kinase